LTPSKSRIVRERSATVKELMKDVCETNGVEESFLNTTMFSSNINMENSDSALG